ncbi:MULTISPECIES: hypothetical protein [Streptomyces]|uniref:hypothetical protein n=1 Tax=Streptomyces TaxID=1883 RepID=UPI0009A54C5F|nr:MULTISPECIES: hypothetical protein [Streptomyces]
MDGEVQPSDALGEADSATGGRAFLFDGKDQYLTLPAGKQQAVAPSGDLTLEAWVNPEAGGGRVIYELIRRLEPYVRPAATSATALATATRETLAAQLPELLPHSAEIIDYFGHYFGMDT